ncbi:MAG: hypothetical protein E7077_01770 [Bacteroidales bacterium]|jgi:YD repeat-containing protein|nr:hypothetical protein [Bacteroidales bacterium]
MIKRILSIIRGLITILVLSSSSDKAKTIWEKDGLKGRVKEIRTYSADESSDKDTKGRLKKITKYDRNGTSEETCYYDSTGNLKSKCIYIYDEYGNNIEEYSYEYKNPLEKDQNESDFTNIDEEERHYKERLVKKWTPTYDANVKIVEWSICEYTGKHLKKKHFTKETIKYDNEGHVVERNSNGKIEYKRTFTYDDHGNIIEESVESDGKLRRKYIYKFDNNGNLTNEKEYMYLYFPKDKLGSTKFSKYDKKGNKIESKEFFSSGGHPLIKTYKYDENGNLIEVGVKHRNLGLNYKESYKYDEKGNKTECIQTDGHKTPLEIRRWFRDSDSYGEFWEYEYYEE